MTDPAVTDPAVNEPAIIAPTFLPWLRSGLAAHLDVPAQAGLAPADTATITITVRARGTGPGSDTDQPVPGPAVRLRGPGEVIGLDPRQVLRRDPEPDTTDAEPHYFAHVELASPDLPWRFTPASPGDGLLQPWLALVVVAERDGVSLEPAVWPARAPVLHVENGLAGELPDLRHCWAWAHVQADVDLTGGVPAALAGAPEAFRSRLLCPRRLTPGGSWLACVVPTFETGRQAGLGEAVTGSGPAWDTETDDAVRLPVYDSWRFSTGPRGDFESLVRRLRPRELPGSVGRRDLDVSDPGGGLPSAPGTLLTYEGALLAPAGAARRWPAAHRTRMKDALRRAVNKRLAPGPHPAPYDALVHDPVVGPPAYGAPQAKRRAVPADGAEPVWLGQLNTEPQHRSVAGLGAEVVRADQEALIAAAWRHAAKMRAVNRTLGRARLAWELGRKAEPRFQTFDDARILQVAGPAMARLTHPTSGTVRGAVAASALPDGLVCGAFRRQTRTVRGFTVSGLGTGTRLPATAAVTAAALAAPIEFASAWRTVHTAFGTEVDEPPPDLGPLVPAAAERRAMIRAARRDRRVTPVRRRARAIDPDPDPGPIRLPDVGGGVPVATLVPYVRAGLDPAGTVKAMVETRVLGLSADRTHDVPPRARAHPAFTTPMSQRLIALSAEYLVPGIGVIPDDTLGLLEVNEPFVEAFLAGLNHELGREFLWREYPARPGATWARRFWDTGPGGPADIPPIGTWAPATSLGGHRPEEAGGAGLVLLFKGALPRRYPDLRVYAVQAVWRNGRRRENKKHGEVRLPVMAGRLESDTRFWGFALDEEDARGSTDPDDARPGWFFVLEQQPGRTRFGLDAPVARFREELPPASWADLSWSHLAPKGDDPLPSFADPTGPSWLADGVRRPGNGGEDAWGEDAAAMARITLQRPIRMLVHADSMLPPPRRPTPFARSGR
ncbi:hypothetical protein EDD29_5185 [Actinocorallia herbida]|uniref:Uncharacterized protein n=1 Tax=Actinocorallia herbida TaxID=58109 RepID=A0A3N1D231_9ACTN|nr:hypothetical protein [Actinocorallia herbida]ROO87572.1 hypothetical protein EDD29_5185 [Actinocorallia herbida]